MGLSVGFKEAMLMTRDRVIVVVALTLVWVILVESLSAIAILVGITISVSCVFFSHRYLPLAKIKGVDFGKLATYPFFLVGQIFSSSIYVSKIIIFGARTDIVQARTRIQNDSLRIMLADSVTLTPGSLLLELQEDDMTILWLRKKSDPDVKDTVDIEGQIMGKLENRLIKAQK